jgi:hypothetical protein
VWPVAQQKSILITVEGEKNFELWLESNRMFLSVFEKTQTPHSLDRSASGGLGSGRCSFGR